LRQIRSSQITEFPNTLREEPAVYSVVRWHSIRVSEVVGGVFNKQIGEENP